MFTILKYIIYKLKCKFDYIIIFITIIIANNCHAKDDMLFGFYYYGGINFNKKQQWSSLQNFFNYYNNTYKNSLIKPLGDDFYFKNSFTHGFEFIIMALNAGIHFSKLQGSTYSILQNGNERHIDIDFKTFQFNSDIVAPIEKIFGIGAVLGFIQHRGEFYSGYKYKFNGYISYAEDKELNGIYSIESSALVLGGRININLKFVNIVFRCQRNISFKTEEESYKLLPLRDNLSFTQSSGIGLFDDGEFRENFPYAPDPKTSYNNLYKYPQNWYFTIQIGIGISNAFD